jgi:hypothetical protein
MKKISKEPPSIDASNHEIRELNTVLRPGKIQIQDQDWHEDQAKDHTE